MTIQNFNPLFGQFLLVYKMSLLMRNFSLLSPTFSTRNSEATELLIEPFAPCCTSVCFRVHLLPEYLSFSRISQKISTDFLSRKLSNCQNVAFAPSAFAVINISVSSSGSVPNQNPNRSGNPWDENRSEPETDFMSGNEHEPEPCVFSRRTFIHIVKAICNLIKQFDILR